MRLFVISLFLVTTLLWVIKVGGVPTGNKDEDFEIDCIQGDDPNAEMKPPALTMATTTTMPLTLEEGTVVTKKRKNRIKPAQLISDREQIRKEERRYHRRNQKKAKQSLEKGCPTGTFWHGRGQRCVPVVCPEKSHGRNRYNGECMTAVEFSRFAGNPQHKSKKFNMGVTGYRRYKWAFDED